MGKECAFTRFVVFGLTINGDQPSSESRLAEFFSRVGRVSCVQRITGGYVVKFQTPLAPSQRERLVVRGPQELVNFLELDPSTSDSVVIQMQEVALIKLFSRREHSAYVMIQGLPPATTKAGLLAFIQAKSRVALLPQGTPCVEITGAEDGTQTALARLVSEETLQSFVQYANGLSVADVHSVLCECEAPQGNLPQSELRVTVWYPRTERANGAQVDQAHEHRYVIAPRPCWLALYFAETAQAALVAVSRRMSANYGKSTVFFIGIPPNGLTPAAHFTITAQNGPAVQMMIFTTQEEADDALRAIARKCCVFQYDRDLTQSICASGWGGDYFDILLRVLNAAQDKMNRRHFESLREAAAGHVLRQVAQSRGTTYSTSALDKATDKIYARAQSNAELVSELVSLANQPDMLRSLVAPTFSLSSTPAQMSPISGSPPPMPKPDPIPLPEVLDVPQQPPKPTQSQFWMPLMTPWGPMSPEQAEYGVVPMAPPQLLTFRPLNYANVVAGMGLAADFNQPLPGQMGRQFAPQNYYPQYMAYGNPQAYQPPIPDFSRQGPPLPGPRGMPGDYRYMKFQDVQSRQQSDVLFVKGVLQQEIQSNVDARARLGPDWRRFLETRLDSTVNFILQGTSPQYIADLVDAYRDRKHKPLLQLLRAGLQRVPLN